jgi:hypothetical protein
MSIEVRRSDVFRDYLRSLPEELLESVTQDYLWLSSLEFEPEARDEFLRRREHCREECKRRGALYLFYSAESTIFEQV